MAKLTTTQPSATGLNPIVNGRQTEERDPERPEQQGWILAEKLPVREDNDYKTIAHFVYEPVASQCPLVFSDVITCMKFNVPSSRRLDTASGTVFLPFPFLSVPVRGTDSNLPRWTLIDNG